MSGLADGPVASAVGEARTSRAGRRADGDPGHKKHSTAEESPGALNSEAGQKPQAKAERKQVSTWLFQILQKKSLCI